MAKEAQIHEDKTSQDLGLEARKVRALEKVAMNLEALVMFFENLNADEWNDRLQWYLDLFKKAYLDPKRNEKDDA